MPAVPNLPHRFTKVKGGESLLPLLGRVVISCFPIKIYFNNLSLAEQTEPSSKFSLRLRSYCCCRICCHVAGWRGINVSVKLRLLAVTLLPFTREE